MKALNTVFKKMAANFKSIFSLLSIVSLLLSTFAFVTASAQAATSSGRYMALTPARISDTRPGSGYPNMGQTLGPNTTLAVLAAGRGGIPASGATAAVVNITAASATAESYLTVYPSGTSRPNTSVVNTKPGQIANNQVTVKLGSDGKINIFNAFGNTNTIVDVLGYYGDAGHTFVSLAPTRIADTRPGSGQPYAGSTMSGNITQRIQVRGKANVPATATAAVVNVTIVGPTANGYLTAYPADTPRPATSNANFVAGEVIAKEMSIKLGDNGSIDLFNGSTGNTNVIVDVLGYYDAVIRDSSNQVYTPVIPERITDTRNSSGQINTGQHIGPGGTLEIKTTGGGPSLSEASAAKASALVVNLTVLNGTAVSYLTTYPFGTARPNSSSINFTTGQLAFNEVTIKLGSNGSFNIFNAFGTADVIVDILGYYSQDPETLPTGPTTDSTTKILYLREGSGMHKTTAYGPPVNLFVSGYSPVWNADQSVIYFTSYHGVDGIYAMAADGYNVVQLTDKRPLDIDLSSAVNKILFTVPETADLNRNISLWTMNTDGTDVRKHYTNSTGNIGAPQWSPAGDKILFQGDIQVAPFGSEFQLLKPSTNEVSVIPTISTTGIGKAISGDSWSPDGTQLTYTAEGRVRIVNVDGTNDRAITPYLPALEAIWSPDGSRIAINTPTTFAASQNILYTVRPDGNLLKQIFTIPGIGLNEISWSPDGQRFAVRATNYSPLSNKLYTFNRDGSNVKLLDEQIAQSYITW